MTRLAMIYSSVVFFSLNAAAVELLYDCHAEIYNNMNVVVAEAHKALPVEGDLCMAAFDLQEKAFSLCTEESIGKLALGVADQNSSQQAKVVSTYGVKSLKVEMQSANEAAYRAEMSCELK